MHSVITFLREAKVELTRVNWPTRDQVMRYTTLVVVISLAVAAFLGGLDYAFSALVEQYVLR